MPKLVDLIEIAKTLNYVEPNKPKEQWDNEDYFLKAFAVAIKNPDQLKANDIICGWFPPLKVLFKTTINKYINYCKSNSITNPNVIQKYS